ncbi:MULTISPECIES: hypothetical protein [Streptomyces]|uniref:Lipoprotein n=1 Tax=Streptomyces wadayamensis TaxID=141454 RepID=A0ABR4S951_9ACTN|nr:MULTISPECIES: hypothetical protein [Streptomyces]MYX85271.1 hypothetical protein [Streptomyces sp. SID4915]KDR62178.1 hypothetical protein DC60_24395 [Streptomyces wadayamensis]QXQ26900.1 hypothetical protein STALF2_20510 [Streptomyces albidoflavus]QXQ32827.1 hypothetical protein STALF4_20580 [Streptomyces albidoflavus]UKL02324.1 hypothetical protein L2I08_05105 [Streptomyces sp. NBU3104]
MARRTLPLAALTAAAALTLTACGGSGEPNDIKGAGGSASAGASEAADEPEGKRPDIGLPKDAVMVVDKGQPAEAAHQPALDDAFRFIQAMRHGIVAQDPDDAAYQYYSTAGAARYARGQIEQWVKGGWTPTGKDQYYDTGTSSVGDGKGVLVTFCRDQSQTFSKSLESGEVHRTEKSPKSFQKYSVLMREKQGESGVWQAGQIEVQGEAKECSR